MAFLNWKLGKVHAGTWEARRQPAIPPRFHQAPQRHVTERLTGWAATMDPAVGTFFPPRSTPPRGSFNRRPHTPFLLSLLHRDNYSTRVMRQTTSLLLGRLFANILECLGAITRDVTTTIHRVVGIPTYRNKVRVWGGTANGRRPRPIPDVQGPSNLTLTIANKKTVFACPFPMLEDKTVAVRHTVYAFMENAAPNYPTSSI